MYLCSWLLEPHAIRGKVFLTGREEAGLGSHEAAGAKEEASACTATRATGPAAAVVTALAVWECVREYVYVCVCGCECVCVWECVRVHRSEL